jgi:hypothetical protein
MKLQLTQWDETGPGVQRDSFEASIDEFMRLLDKISSDYSAVISLNDNDERLLLIGANSGRFTATISIPGKDDDTTMDLVGDATAAGDVEFVLGGQPAPAPRRHVVTREAVSNVGQKFIRGEDLQSLPWEVQELGGS